MDNFDSYHDKRDDDPKKATRQSTGSITNLQPTVRSGPAPRKPLPSSDDSKASTPQNGTKEPQPAANPPSAASQTTSNGSAPSKKRKAASQSTSINSQPQTPASQPPPVTQPKKAPAGAANGNGHANGNGIKLVNGNDLNNGRGYPETNMLTFGDCNAKPTEDGKMVADDGTVLEVNGKLCMLPCRKKTSCMNGVDE